MMRQAVYLLAVVAVAFAKGDGRPYPSTKNTKNAFHKQEPQKFASVASYHTNAAQVQQPDAQQYHSQQSFQQQDAQQFQPSPYSFNYEAEGSARSESSDASGKVTGSYSVTNADGSVRVVKYVADHNGFRADVDTNEAGTKTSNPANAEFKSAFVEPAAPVQQYSAGASSYKGQYEQKPIQFSLDSQGGYSYNYESKLDDGGSSEQSESSDGSGTVTGRYSLTGSDGRRRQVDYSSGGQGFQAKIDTNEFGTKSESPANVQFYSSAADQGPAPAPTAYSNSKTNFAQQKQQVHFNSAPIQQQSIQATKFATSPVPVKQQPIQDYAQFESKPSPYAFSYDAQLEDGSSSRTESADASGKVVGSYSLSAADGRKRTIDYVADHQGFRATVNTNEFGTKSDSPADVQLYSNAPAEAPTHYKSSASQQFSKKGFSQEPIKAFSQEAIQPFSQQPEPVKQFSQEAVSVHKFEEQKKPAQHQFNQKPITVPEFVKKPQQFSQEPVAASFEQKQIKSTWSAAASNSNQFKSASQDAAVQYNQGSSEQYAPFEFNYVANLEDGGSSSRSESGDGSGKVVGSYSLTSGDSRRTVDYLADQSGFRATVNTNEFGTKSESPADVQFYSSAVQEPEHQEFAAMKPANAGGHYSAQASSAGHYSTGSKTSFASQQKVQSFATQQRVEEPAIQQQPSPYSFGYEAEAAGGSSARSESADASGKVTGSYTVRNEDGSVRVVEYIADHNGFRANVKTNEPGTKSDDPADVMFKSDAPVYAAAPAQQQQKFMSKTNSRTKSSMISQKSVEPWRR